MGSMAIIISLLFGSAILRVSLSAGEALAASAAIEELQLDHSGESEEFKPETQPTSRLLQEILKREQRVVTLERDLAIRKQAMNIAKVEIERRISALESAESRLSATLTKADTAAEADVNQLIKVYESMKPKDSAALFETMEPTFAAGFLGRMRPDVAAGVMAGLTPKVAYSISVILAGRNANAPKN